MPPKPKYTKEEIAKVALDIVKKEGVSALTARELGNKLHSSASPIFTIFKNMEEVKQAARKLGLKEFEEYASDFQDYTPAFKRIGMLMVSYGIHQPEMFKLLFMQEHINEQKFENTISDLGEMADICIGLIQRDYEMTKEQAKILFDQMWIHTFGLGALCAMKVCDFTEEELAEKLGQVFAGMVMVIQSGNLDNTSIQPVKNEEWNQYGKSVCDMPYVQK